MGAAYHLYLILTIYPQAGLQYGYDINRPDVNMGPFQQSVLTPFFRWVCADWEIDDELEIDEILQSVADQVCTLLKSECHPALKNILDSAQSSGNTSEVSDSSTSRADSDTDNSTTEDRETDDDQQAPRMTSDAL